jgi:hypothetical protein
MQMFDASAKYGAMSLDKFSIFWYNKYPKPSRISAARWAAMTSQYVRNYGYVADKTDNR